MIHKRHITSIAVAIATVLLIAGPAMAVGKFQPERYHGLSAASYGPSAAEVTPYWPDAPPAAVSRTPTSGPTVVHVTSGSNTFDWGDAAIGAGAAVLVMVLVAGGLRVTSHRPRPGLAKTG